MFRDDYDVGECVRKWCSLCGLFGALFAFACASGCVQTIPSPFVEDASQDTENDADAAVDSADDQQDTADRFAPKVGQPCSSDNDCDDEIPCTHDECDETTQRCRHTGNHGMCQDQGYCNGAELCDPAVGCVTGEPITCSDDDPCTIDRCIEATRSCEHIPRDVDGDGDPDWHCGGGDCDDTNPLVNSHVQEICGNGRDDNCNEEIDEQPCVTVAHDTCADPLMLTSGVQAELQLFGAGSSLTASCVPSGLATLRNGVAAIMVPDDRAYDLDAWVQGDTEPIFIAVSEQCGKVATELACNGEGVGPLGAFARVMVRNVPAGPLPIYVFSAKEMPLQLKATLMEASAGPTNETCATAIALEPGKSQVARLAGTFKDLATACDGRTGDLVYRFTTEKNHDLYVYATSLDGRGEPVLSLRGEHCSTPADELRCRQGNAPVLYARALTAGTYFISVSATAPTDVSFKYELSDPSTPPVGDTCDDAPQMDTNVTHEIALDGYFDTVKDSCLENAPDAVRSISLTETSDVLLLGNITSGDKGAVSLWKPGCSKADLLGCEMSNASPVRWGKKGIAPGDYRVVIETEAGNPARLTAFTRAAVAPNYVLFSDTCETAYAVGKTGGTFYGNTAGGIGRYAASCDQGGIGKYGAPEQFLKLQLDEKRRVILDARESSYQTLINVRKGPTCPGQEVTRGCTIGVYQQNSFLDLELEAGIYYIQIDGYYGDYGAWTLDVFVVP